MIGAVVQDHSEVHHRKSCQISAGGCVFDSLFDGGNIVLGNRAAENVVDEFELAAARQRFHLDFAVAVLAVSAGLFLVLALDVGLAANGLAVRAPWALSAPPRCDSASSSWRRPLQCAAGPCRRSEIPWSGDRGRSAAWRLLPSACGCRGPACLRRRGSWVRWRR